MRRLTYTTAQLTDEGAGVASPEVTAPLAELLFGTTISFLHVVPPLEVLNETLQIGGTIDTGNLWYRWEPFTIGPEEYEGLVAEVLKHPE